MWRLRTHWEALTGFSFEVEFDRIWVWPWWRMHWQHERKLEIFEIFIGWKLAKSHMGFRQSKGWTPNFGRELSSQNSDEPSEEVHHPPTQFHPTTTTDPPNEPNVAVLDSDFQFMSASWFVGFFVWRSVETRLCLLAAIPVISGDKCASHFQSIFCQANFAFEWSEIHTHHIVVILATGTLLARCWHSPVPNGTVN